MTSALRTRTTHQIEHAQRLLETGRHELAATALQVALDALNTCPHGHTGELRPNNRCNACRRQRRALGHNA